MDDFTTRQINKRLGRIETDIEVLQAAVRELRAGTAGAGSETVAFAPNVANTPLEGYVPRAGGELAPKVQMPLPPPPPPPPPMPPSTPAPLPTFDAAIGIERIPQTPAFRPNVDFLSSTEFWLNKVGIGLLLLGLAFLFKYSIDQGWLNEQVRVGFGLGLGSVLLALGVAFHPDRRHFSQVLLGGSVATYYITGFAAYELYNLVPYEVAYGYMVAVTVLAFVLSVRQNESVLALVGTIGGLGTPFILYRPEGSLPALVTYTCLVLAGTSAIYFYKGWRSLLWTSYIGGWAVFAIGYFNAFWANTPTMSDRWALQGAALFSALAFWALPVLREALRAEDPTRWPHPDPGRLGDVGAITETHVHLLVISVPLLALAASASAWGEHVEHQVWGGIAIGAAALYLRVFLATRRNTPTLAYTHAMMAVLLLTLGVFQVFVGDTTESFFTNRLFLALAVEATALHFVSARLRDKGTSIYGHLIFASLALQLADRLLAPHGSNVMSVLNWDALTDLGVMALGMVASFVVAPREAVITYRNVVYIAFVAWLWHELSSLTGGNGYFVDGQGYVMLAWAAFAALLNTLHRRLPRYFTLHDTTMPAFTIFGGVAALFAARVVSGHGGDPNLFGNLAFMNIKTLIDAVVVSLVAESAYEVRPREASYVYRMAAHAGVLALVWRELAWLENGSSYVLVTWAAYATLWQFVARRTGDRVTEVAAHIPFVAIALAFVAHILGGQEGERAIFNVKAISDVAVILLALCVSTLVKERWIALSYRLASHVAFMALLWRELAALENGNAYVTISWGLYALILVIAGVYVGMYTGRSRSLLYVAIVTLFAVVAKLLLLDLVMLEEVWRILLFLGFGALFLTLSYYFQNLLMPAKAQE